MTLYLGITTTKNIKLPRWAQDKPEHDGDDVITTERGDFAVARQLRALGFEAWCPRKIEFKRQGKRRHPDPIISPYLPGYVFIESSAHQYHEIFMAQGIGRTLMAIGQGDLRGERRNKDGEKVKGGNGVLDFLTWADARLAEAERIIENNDRAAMVQYSPGDPLEIISGPFMDRAVRFTAMVQEAGDMHPMVAFETELFGRVVAGKVDPLDVKRAKA